MPFAPTPWSHHLIKDKWAALFGAIVFGILLPSTDGSTAPSMYVIGTLPLTVYFLRRALIEHQWRLAVLAGLCAGVTSLISVKVFACILVTIAIYACFLAISRWKQTAFWLFLLLFIGVCALIAAFRLYPMIADEALRQEGLGRYEGALDSNDVLDFLVLGKHPFTGGFLRALFNVPPDASPKNAYLGYINIFLALGAILHKSRRRQLLPWLAILAFFAVMRLGDFLTYNGVEHSAIVLPARVLRAWFPTTFGALTSWAFQIGVVTPLVVLSCFGLAALSQSRAKNTRVALVLAATLVFAFELYVPHPGKTLESGKLAYVDWLKSEADDPVKVINLPQGHDDKHYYFYAQSVSGYQQAYGFINRNPESARTYIDDNLLLRNWDQDRSVHCLPYNQGQFMDALERLLADGFTHIVEHDWLWGDQFIDNTFWNVPEAYDDDFVKVYRLRDLRLSCETVQVNVPRIDRFLQSALLIPGRRSSILSFHPDDRLDDNLVDYLSSLFSDWDSFPSPVFRRGPAGAAKRGRRFHGPGPACS